MRTLLLIFTCKRPKYADTGGRGGQKKVKFCGRPLWMAPYKSFWISRTQSWLVGCNREPEDFTFIISANTKS